MDFGIEIIEFFPFQKDNSKNSFTGTIKATISSIGIDILGISVFKRDNFWFFRMPSKSSFDSTQKKTVHYPTVSFTNREVQKTFIDELRHKGKDFIEKRIQDTENPIKWNEMPKPQTKNWNGRKKHVGKATKEKTPPFIQHLEKMVQSDYVSVPQKPSLHRKKIV
jgi:hypothetical protein